jgi:Ca2+-binding RTX toxin-like protein
VPYVNIYNSVTGAVSPLFLPYDASGTNLIGEPVIARLTTNGHVVVVWKEGSGGSNVIVRTTFDPATGAAIGPREVVVSSFTGDTDPEITALNGGGYVITFNDPGSGIWFNAYDGSGAYQTQVNLTANGAIDPAVVATDDGGFAIVYVFGGDIYSQTFDPSGTATSAVKTEVSGNTNSAPQVAALKGGGFAIVYDDANFGGQPGIGLKLSTSAQDVVIRVDSKDGANGDRDPEITVLDNGFIVVTWTHEFSATDDDIYGRVFTANGTPIVVSNANTSGVFVIDGSTLDQTQSSLAALLNGMFVTTWTNAGADGSSDGISGDVRELMRTITSDAAGDTLNGDELRDTLIGNGGDDFLYGNGGNDVLFGGASANDAGPSGVDVLVGGAGNDTLHGNDGADLLRGGADVDAVLGGAGNDIIFISEGDDAVGETYNGGSETDTISSGQQSNGYTINLRDDFLNSIEKLNIGQSSIFSYSEFQVLASQFGTGLSFSLEVTGSNNAGNADVLNIFFSSTDTDLDLTGLTFIDFDTANDGIRVQANDVGNSIEGSSVNDDIFGLGGTDQLYGYSGTDQLFGGTEDDILVGGAGIDHLFGGAGNDNLTHFNAAENGVGETYDGGADTDTISINSGFNSYALNLSDDVLVSIEALAFGNSGPDETGKIIVNASQFGTGLANNLRVIGPAAPAGSEVLEINMAGQTTLNLVLMQFTEFDRATSKIVVIGGTAAEDIVGSSVKDEISGGAGRDIINGGNGADILRGGADVDSVFGGAGDDSIFISEGDDAVGETYNGGIDTDTISSGVQSDGYIIDLRNDFLTSIEKLNIGQSTFGVVSLFQVLASQFGTGLSTTLEVTGSIDDGNNDLLQIDFSAADINFDLRNLTFVNFSDAFDKIYVNANGVANIINGSSVKDQIDGSGGADTLFGNGGDDRLYGGNDIDFLYGGTGSDELNGGQGNDTLYGGSAAVDATDNFGNDILSGNDGLDSIYGNGGNDTIAGGAGADFLIGGTGNDTVYGGDSATDVTDLSDDFIRGGAGIDTLYGNGGNDTIYGGEDGDNMYGGDGNDIMLGGGLAVDPTDLGDTMFGGNGADDIKGNGGDDFLYGEAGDDSIIGGLGNDDIYGGLGNDYLRGGLDVDRFIFNTALNAATNMDTIQAFVVGTDKIVLSQAIFAGIGGILDLAEFQLGAAANDAADRIIYNSATGQLFYDSNGSVGGSTNQIQFALMTVASGALPVLSISDFFMVA